MKRYILGNILGIIMLFPVLGIAVQSEFATNINAIVVGTRAHGDTANVATGQYELYVNGDIETDGNLNVAGTIEVTGNIDVNGSLLLDVTEITTSGLSSTQTLTVSQSGYIIIVATEAVTLNLPAVSGNAGLTYEVKLDSVSAVAVYTVTLDGNASETIDGSATNTQINNWYDYLKIVCDGDEWFIVAEKEH